MVRAGKGKTMSLALPNKLHAAMKAYVMEGAKLTRAFAANQDRRRQASYFPYNPIFRLRKFLLTGDIQTDPTEDRPLLFEPRPEEHTSEIQELMRTSYAVFCLTQKQTTIHIAKYFSSL